MTPGLQLFIFVTINSSQFSLKITHHKYSLNGFTICMQHPLSLDSGMDLETWLVIIIKLQNMKNAEWL